jgi:Kef-type K+ transport system membrane component KefB
MRPQKVGYGLVCVVLHPSITSVIAGAFSYLFLKAGLLVLESSSKSDASEIGFFALAFIAGLNVDKFVAKIEEVAKAVWGIDKSRASETRSPPDNS